MILTALDIVVEPFRHTASLLHGIARALNRHVVAARIRGHAEPALDQGEVLTVLAEQRRGEPVVVERQDSLGRAGAVLGAGNDGFLRSQRAHQAPAVARSGSAATSAAAAGGATSAPNRLLG